MRREMKKNFSKYGQYGYRKSYGIQKLKKKSVYVRKTKRIENHYELKKAYYELRS